MAHQPTRLQRGAGETRQPEVKVRFPELGRAWAVPASLPARFSSVQRTILLSGHASPPHPPPPALNRGQPLLFLFNHPWRGRAVLKSRSHNRQVANLPNSSELKKIQPLLPQESAHSFPHPVLPRRQPAGRESDAGVGQEASKRVSLASCLDKTPTFKHWRFAPRPTHLTSTAGR